MKQNNDTIYDKFVTMLHDLSQGRYEDIDFEQFMTVENPLYIRNLAQKLNDVVKQVRSREEYLKIAIEELRSTRTDIEDFNKVIEKRVKERTKMLEQANLRLEFISTTDPLTGISNRRHFENQLKREISRARRYATSLCCIMFDIDFFKKVNDNYGHIFGDAVLKTLGNILQENLREHDIYARYGGEEFIVLLPETDANAAYYVAEKLRGIIAEKQIKKNDHQDRVTVSLGVAVYDPEQMSGGEDLVSAADKALYNAKHSGRNRTAVFQSHSQESTPK